MSEAETHTHTHPNLHLETNQIAAAGFEAWGSSSILSSFPLDWDTSALDEEDIDLFLTRFPPPTSEQPSVEDTEQIQSIGVDAFRFSAPAGIMSPYSKEQSSTPQQSSVIGRSTIFDRLEVLDDGYTIQFHDMHAYASVLSSAPIVFLNEKEQERGYVYFEVEIKKKHSHSAVSVGLATKPYPPFRMIGWSKYSVGYHSDDGRSFICNDTGVFGVIYATAGSEGGSKGQKYDEKDIVGVGYYPERGAVFFTLNGKYLGEANGGDLTKGESKHPYHAAIGANGASIIHVNFGQSGEFKYAEANLS